ncbi:MAG: carboxypeptidase regulatory-like domain-containing protein [Bryobacteraceae bacterium]
MPHPAFRLFLCLALAAAAFPQGAGTIYGTVKDSSGAIVPNAQVLITNSRTGFTRQLETNPEGAFFLSPLPVGEYQLEAQFSGFQKFIQKGIILNADANARVDVELTVGESSRSITVTADAALVDTTRSMQVTLVDSARMKDLPLNGRNPLDLQFLQPGVTRHRFNSGGENEPVSVNGSRGTMNNYTLDGGNAVDAHTGTAAAMPNPDALEEFSIVQFANSAEYGRGAGGQVNVVTKSGTNSFHGSAFHFLRNDKLNARDYFSPSRSVYRKNQYGGTFGGPVFKDKTFFFGSYQGTRQRLHSTRTIRYLPSDLERVGNFSNSVQRPNDPLTGARFPNDLIPTSRIDPASRKFTDLWVPRNPEPVGGPYRFNYPTRDDSDQYLFRGDHHLSSNNRISARYFHNTHPTRDFGNLPGFNLDRKFTARNLSVNNTHTFRANLVNDFRYTFGRVVEFGTPFSGQSLETLGVKVHVPEVLGYKWIYIDTGDFGVRDIRPGRELRDLHQFTNTVLHVRGKHSLKFGGEARRTITDYFIAGFSTGYFSFTNQFTRVNMGDFLLGLPVRYSQSNSTVQRGIGTEYDFFVQDDYRIARTFTLNFGVRYEPRVPPYDREGHMSYYQAGAQSTLYPNAPAGMLFTGDPQAPKGGYRGDFNNFAPRIGFAWDVTGDGKTSIRSGYGVFYDNLLWSAFQAQAGTQPFSLAINLNAPGSFVDPFGASGMRNPFPFTPGPGTFPFTYPLSVYAFDPNFRTGYLQQWQFAVERRVTSDSIVRAAYVGSKGSKLWWGRDLNAARFVPGASTVANTDARRPLAPQIAQLDWSESRGASNYHALQLTYNKRFHQGLTFNGAYSWSKSIDLGSQGRALLRTPHPNNPNANRGRSEFHLTHVFVGSFVWDLPFLQQRNTLASKLFGGWRVSGITTAQSGQVFTVAAGRASSLSGTGSERADWNGQELSISGDRTRAQELARWFNTAAFTAPPDGSWGSAGRGILEGPGLFNFDMALNKDFRILEGHSLNIRGEAFNAFNTVNFGNPDATLTSANFGRILTTGPGRVMQVALRYTF